MKILFAASEAAPFFKTGGLGDVAAALPIELSKDQEIDIRVVLPNYTQMPTQFKEQLIHLTDFRFQLGRKNVYCGIKVLKQDRMTYYFVDNLSYFDRASLYGEWDDGERFAFFSMAIIEMLEVIDWIPQIIHCNDWQTAMVPVLLVDKYHWKERLRSIRKLLTIHNLRFQGWYPSDMLEHVFGTGYNTFTEDGLKIGNQINYLKGGINFSDRVTTVSPSYAQEILTPAFGEGLEGVLQHNAWKIEGILNGIDRTLNDPANDANLAFSFDEYQLEGKAKNKSALQTELGLERLAGTPLIGMVTRLTDQKGLDLVINILEVTLQREIQFVVLGTGDANFEHALRSFEHRYPQKMRACIQFDSGRAQRIYAGADLFLMPSAFEPCGLSQMIAMRYGTLPLVHETGGLKDTVQPYNQYTGEGTGFSFYGFHSHNLLNILNYALDTYTFRQQDWAKMIKQAMKEDFSWTEPAKQYKRIYQELLNE